MNPHQWLAEYEPAMLAELYELLRIPSVSTKPEHRGHVRQAAEWVAAACRRIGALPVNVILLAEGEEEVGSKSLPAFLAAHQQRLASDYLVVSDTAMFAPGIPSILGSMRGIAYFEVTARAAPSDLHSGQYGGAVPNAATALARVAATFHDDAGRVAISGFYDAVRAPAPRRREEIARLPFDEAQFRAGIGVEVLPGEPGYSPLERIWLRPTCEVNGIVGGYTGAGAKTVIPGAALLKVSFRLVPDQTPEAVERLLAAHLARVAPPGVTLGIRRLHGGLPWAASAEGPAVDAARRALAAAFGREAVIGGTGGSIPIVSELERALETRETLLVGFGLPGENAHAPNEWLDLDNFRRGARAIVALYDELGTLGRDALRD